MANSRLACPNCSGGLDVTPQFDWYCRTCEASQIPRLDGVATGFPDRVLDTFPFPLALTCHFVRYPDNAATGLMNLVGAYTSLIRFSALVLVSQFLSSDLESPQSAQAVLRLRTPSLDNWHSALFTLSDRLFGPAPKGTGGTPFSPALIHSIQAFKDARVGRQSVHELFRAFRNDEHGHKTAWTEADCARHLESWRPALDWVLALFDSLGSIEVLRKDEHEYVVMQGCREPLLRQPMKGPWLEQAFAKSDLVLRNADGELLPLYPLFIVPARSPISYLEDLLAFDGHGTQDMTFRGVRLNSARRSEPLSVYRRLVDAKGATPRVSKQELRPWTLADWAFSGTTSTIENLQGVKYFPQYYQERRSTLAVRGVDDTVESWLERRKESALLVAATAGAGKTSLLCRIAEKLLEQGDAPGAHADCVLLLLGGQIRGGRGQLFERVRSGLGIREDASGVQSFAELLEAWRLTSREDSAAGERRMILLLDAVNESEDAKALLEEASELAAAAASANRKGGRAWVRLLLTVRTERLEALFRHWEERHDTPFLTGLENFAHFEDERGRQAPYLELRSFLPTEAGEAYGRSQTVIEPSCPARWEELVPATKEVLRLPQMLPLFHRVYAGQAIVPGVASEESLWRAWLDVVVGGPGSGGLLERLALDLADACIDGGHDQIPVELAAQWRRRWEERLGSDPLRIAAEVDDLERLAVAGLLRQNQEGDWDWVSDLLAEHVLHRALRRRCWPPRSEVIGEWLRLPATVRLVGALVHLAEELWHEDRTALVAEFARPYRGGGKILGRAISAVCPRGNLLDIEGAIQRFSSRLKATGEEVQKFGNAQGERVLIRSLLWGPVRRLEFRWGATPAITAILRESSQLAKRLAEDETDDPAVQRELAISYSELGDMVCRSDPAAAKEWYELSLKIFQQVAEAEPDSLLPQDDLAKICDRLGAVMGRSDPAAARHFHEQSMKIDRRRAEAEVDNLQAWRGVAVSCNQLGDLALRSDAAAARQWYEQSLEIRRRLAEAEPGNLEFQRDLSVSYNRVGDLERPSDLAAAQGWYKQSLKIRRWLAEAEPDNFEAQRDLSVSYSKMGSVAEQSDPAVARHWYEQSLKIDQQLAETERDNLLVEHGLAVTCTNLGDVTERTDPAARHWYEQSLKIFQRLAAAEPDNLEAQRDLSSIYKRLGEVAEQSDPGAAREWYEQSLKIRQRLAAAETDKLEVQRDLSLIYGKLGDLAGRSDPAAAREWHGKSLKIDQRLAAAEPDNAQAQRDLSFSYSRLGDVAGRSDPEAARAWYEQSLKIRQRLAVAEPDNPEALRDLSLIYSKLAYVASRSDAAAAREWYERSLRFNHRLAEAEPGNLQVQRDLSTNYCHLGDLVGRSDPAAAREWYEQSLKIDQSLAEKEPDNPQAQRELSISYIRLGDLARRSDPATARTWYEQSLGIRKRLAEAERNGADGRELLADCFGRLAVTLREGGLLTEANCGYQQALELFAEAERSSPGNPGPFYSRACIHAIWGASEQALQALQQAVELRYDDADWVANDPDFAALRGMSEFEQLLMRMRQRSAAIL